MCAVHVRQLDAAADKLGKQLRGLPDLTLKVVAVQVCNMHQHPLSSCTSSNAWSVALLSNPLPEACTSCHYRGLLLCSHCRRRCGTRPPSRQHHTCLLLVAAALQQQTALCRAAWSQSSCSCTWRVQVPQHPSHNDINWLAF